MLTQLLSTLEKHQSHATLLLTPELLESAGDGVRRAAATGNAVALRIDAATAAEALTQIERGNDALWRAASLRTRLVYLESADRTLRAAGGGLLSHHDQHVRLYAQRHTLGRHCAQMGRPLHQCAALPRRGERCVLRARHSAQPPACGELHDRGAERGHSLIKPLQNVQEKRGKPIIIRTFQR